MSQPRRLRSRKSGDDAYFGEIFGVERGEEGVSHGAVCVACAGPVK